MDGIPVKISELYKPPKKITLPSGIANRQPIENFEQYDFRLERSTAEKMAKLRELKKASVEKRKQRLAAEDKKLEELKKAVAETNAEQKLDSCETPGQDSAQETESAAEKSGETASCMLTPVPVNQAHQQLINHFDPVKRGPINISDFESDSSPFDNMELKTLNDIAELASVLQPNNVSQASYQQNFNQDDHRLTNQTMYNQGYDMKQSADDQRLTNQAIYNQQGYDSFKQQSTDDQRLTNQSMYNQSGYDMKPSTDDHQLTMYNQHGYDIKPSRPFIQQPPNILPSNGYRVNGLYNTSNVYNTSSVSWNHQPTLSYTSARTTPSVYGGGVASTYRPGYSTSEFGAVYASQNSDYRSENVGYNTSQNNDYPQFMHQTSEYTQGEYASKYGNDYVVSQPTNTVSKMGSSSTSNYMLPTSSVSVTRIASGTNNTATNNRPTSEYLPKLGGTLEYAPTFPWTNYNYQQANAYVGGQAKVNPIVQQSSGASVESRLSSDSGVTDLIRELKLELDDRRESDSRKVVENERIIASNAAVENDKLKQKIVSKMASPQLPNPINQLTTSCRQLVRRIAEMGFAEQRVARAVHRLGDNETKVLEFLLQIQRLEEETGCTAERVEQALIANRYDSVESARYLEILQQLLDLGFVETKVTEALARHSNDRDKAIESLIS